MPLLCNINRLVNKSVFRLSSTAIGYSFNTDFSASFVGPSVPATDIVRGSGLTTCELFTNGYPYQVLRVVSGYATDADSVTNDSFFSFTITAPGKKITGIQLKAARGGAATPRGFRVRTSADGYATALGGVTNVNTQRPNLTSYTYPVDLPITDSITIRVYMWASPINGSVEFKDVTVTLT